MGILLYQKGNEIKEYIYQNLNTPLQGGKIYCLSFFVKRSQRGTYAIKNIEVLFSNNSVNTGTIGYINALPQITKQNVFVSDTVNWIEVQGCFTANGGEQFMTIGNFNNNANTDTLFMGTNNPISGYGDFSHYYIDDITLIDQSTVGVNELSNGTSVSVYPNPVNDIINFTNINDKEDLTIKIADVIGRNILMAGYKSQLDISFLEKGIYFVAIEQANKTLSVKKIIKQ